MTRAEINRKFEKAIKSDLKEGTPKSLPEDIADTFDIEAFKTAVKRAAMVLTKEEKYVNSRNRTVHSGC
ncbi:MAG TPA: hypothetical protein VJL27_01960 [Patescibacteria group bacterium]|nr:hypothetical protein [Patescibacteria group bacterium]